MPDLVDVPLFDAPPRTFTPAAKPGRVRPAGPGVNPDPITPDIMPASAGAWVREHVIPARYLPGATEGYWTRCACQYGICGACEMGDCGHCLSVGRGRVVSPLARITDRRGFVASAPDVSSADVWPVGRPCGYVCPCRCDKTPPVPVLAPVVPVVPVQLDLFGVAS